MGTKFVKDCRVRLLGYRELFCCIKRQRDIINKKRGKSEFLIVELMKQKTNEKWSIRFYQYSFFCFQYTLIHSMHKLAVKEAGIVFSVIRVFFALFIDILEPWGKRFSTS
jgi:hypothetical protein